MVEFILLKLLFLTIAGTMISFAMYLIQTLLQKQLSLRARYYMWLIPLALFIFPFSAVPIHTVNDSSLYVPAIYRSAQTVRAEQLSTQPVSKEQLEQTMQTAQTTQTRSNSSFFQKTVKSSFLKNYAWMTPEFLKHTTAELFIISWIAGILLLFIRKRIHGYRFKKALMPSLFSPSEDLKIHFEQCKRDIGIKRPITLKMMRAQVSPFMTGLLRPAVILPADINASDGITPVIYHELMHCKKHDLWYMQFMDLVKIIHWFNPAVYWISEQLHGLMELSCDESVSLKINETMKKNYSKSIITMMRTPFIYKKTSAHLSEQGQNIKKRLEVIMNTKSSKKKTFISLATAAVMLFFSISASAAINGQNNSASYAVNHLTDNGSFTYSRQLQNESEIGVNDLTGSVYHKAGKTSGAVRDITLINTPFYKSFYASVKAENYYLKNGAKTLDKDAGQYFSPEDGQIFERRTDESTGETYTAYTSEPAVPIQADIEIRMDEFTKELEDGNLWNGLFSVIINHTVVMDHIPGTIRNIPSARKTEAAFLEIYDEKTQKHIRIDGINFNVYGSDTIIARAALADLSERLATDPATRCVTLGEPTKTVIDGNDITPKESSKGNGLEHTVYYNPNLTNISCESLPYYIPSSSYTRTNTLYSSELLNYTCTNDTIKGTFFSNYYSKFCEEIKGTFSGLSGKLGDTVTFRSDDGSFSVEWPIVLSQSKDIDLPNYTVSYDRTEQDENSHWQKFYNHRVTVSRAVGTDALPFTLSFADDLQTVTLTVKENIGTYWSFAEATYKQNAGNIWETRNADSGETVFVLPVWNGYSHNIAFKVYNDTPCISKTTYDLMFRVTDGKIYWSSHSRYHQFVEDITGEDAKITLAELKDLDSY